MVYYADLRSYDHRFLLSTEPRKKVLDEFLAVMIEVQHKFCASPCNRKSFSGTAGSEIGIDVLISYRTQRSWNRILRISQAMEAYLREEVFVIMDDDFDSLEPRPKKRSLYDYEVDDATTFLAEKIRVRRKTLWRGGFYFDVGALHEMRIAYVMELLDAFYYTSYVKCALACQRFARETKAKKIRDSLRIKPRHLFDKEFGEARQKMVGVVATAVVMNSVGTAAAVK
jgi:hypothetical protein